MSRWNPFPEKKPTESGWYICTIAFGIDDKNIQSYVMELWWDNNTHKFKNNLRSHVFEMYKVYDCSGKQLYMDNLCDRTNRVVAWRERPKKYWLSQKEVNQVIERTRTNG